MSIGSILSSITHINDLLSFAGVADKIKPLISQALSGASLDAMARSVLSSGVINTLESMAEHLFPNVAPELRLAAGAVASYNQDKTIWLQQALNAILGDTLVDGPLAVDGIYGPATVKAVEQFQQQSVGLKKDGWAYRITTPLIEAALAKVLAKSPKVADNQVPVTAPAQVVT